jgi:EEF1A lysine methyltransferase 4
MSKSPLLSFGNRLYWDDFYETCLPLNLDWYFYYDDMKKVLMPHLPSSKSASFLHVGCGVSELAIKLYRAGYKNITNIDYADSAITQMREFHTMIGVGDTMRWLTMDVGDVLTEFGEESFDVVVDKGCLDAILCGTDDIAGILYAIYSVTMEGGSFLMFSCGPPKTRLLYLQEFSWDVEAINCSVCYLYVCRK